MHQIEAINEKYILNYGSALQTCLTVYSSMWLWLLLLSCVLQHSSMVSHTKLENVWSHNSIVDLNCDFSLVLFTWWWEPNTKSWESMDIKICSKTKLCVSQPTEVTFIESYLYNAYLPFINYHLYISVRMNYFFSIAWAACEWIKTFSNSDRIKSQCSWLVHVIGNVHSDKSWTWQSCKIAWLLMNCSMALQTYWLVMCFEFHSTLMHPQFLMLELQVPMAACLEQYGGSWKAPLTQ